MGAVATSLMPPFTPAQAVELEGTFGSTPIAAYAAGTVYTLTATSAAVDFGTTDPAIVINKPGTYQLSASGVIEYVGATFAANRTITVKLRRTNNTAADVSNATWIFTTAVITTITQTAATFVIPSVYYTTTRSDDAITIFADVSVLPSAGSVTVSAANISARKIY